MPRVLYIATSDVHVNVFHLPFLEWLRKQGHSIDLVIEDRRGIQIPHVDRIIKLRFPRTPLHGAHGPTYRRLKRIIGEGEYKLVHCHTPIPSALARLAARRARSRGTKVLYTAHGLHFFKGAPLRYWLAIYPIERWLARYTDGIVLINTEDYERVASWSSANETFHINGVGVDPGRFRRLTDEETSSLRKEYGYGPNDFIVLYVAEFIRRKNHRFVIDAIPDLVRSVPTLRVLLAGRGMLLDEMQAHAKRAGVEQYVEFLGFRKDIPQLANLADIGISSSRQEGLGLGLVEQMLCGTPIVASADRGHRELVINGQTGYLYPQGGQAQFVRYVETLYRAPTLRRQLGARAYDHAQKFTLDHAVDAMAQIYQRYL